MRNFLLNKDRVSEYEQILVKLLFVQNNHSLQEYLASAWWRRQMDWRLILMNNDFVSEYEQMLRKNGVRAGLVISWLSKRQTFVAPDAIKESSV